MINDANVGKGNLVLAGLLPGRVGSVVGCAAAVALYSFHGGDLT